MWDRVLPDGVRVPFQGTCNQCGQCCTTVYQGRDLRCEHLVVTGALGTPQATRCRAYAYREDGMAVLMLDDRGIPRQIGPCGKDSSAEDRQILRRGLGRGCSLTVPTSPGTWTGGS